MDDVATGQRRQAAEAAAALVEPGMSVGLGTGRTALLFVEALAARVREGLDVADVVATSGGIAAAAEERGLRLRDMMAADVAPAVDIAVDGADEIDGQLRLVKGGGGSLLREKIVAQMAARFVVIADEAKKVARLGAFPLPVEVVPFGWHVTAGRIAAATGVAPVLRGGPATPFVSDNGNHILDCPLGAIDDPQALVARLLAIPGVVEHGLFLEEATEALIGTPAGVERLARKG